MLTMKTFLNLQARLKKEIDKKYFKFLFKLKKILHPYESKLFSREYKVKAFVKYLI